MATRSYGGYTGRDSRTAVAIEKYMKPWSALLDALQGDMSGSKIQGAEKLKAYLAEWQASVKDDAVDLEPMMNEYIAALSEVFGSNSRPPAEYSLRQLRDVNENDVKLKVEHMVGLLGPFSMSVQTKTELEKLIRMFVKLVAKNREMRLQHARMSVIVPAYIVNFSKLLRETTEQSVATHFVVDKYQNVVMEQLFGLLGKEGDDIPDPENERILANLQKLIVEIKRITERDEQRGAQYAQELLQKANESIVLKLAKGEDVMSDKIRRVLQSLHPKPDSKEISMLDIEPEKYSALYGLYVSSAQQAQAPDMESPESYEQRYTKKVKLSRTYQPPAEVLNSSAPATLELHPYYIEMLMQLWTPASKDWVALDTYISEYVKKWNQTSVPPEQVVPCISLWLTLRELYQRPVGMLSDRLYKFMYDALRAVSSPLVSLVDVTALKSLTQTVRDLSKHIADNANASGLSRANDLMKVCDELSKALSRPRSELDAAVADVTSKLPDAMPADASLEVAGIGRVVFETTGGDECASVKLTSSQHGVSLTIDRGIAKASRTDKQDALYGLFMVAYAVSIKPALVATKAACALRAWARTLPTVYDINAVVESATRKVQTQQVSQKKQNARTQNNAGVKTQHSQSPNVSAPGTPMRASQSDSDRVVDAEIRLKNSKPSAPPMPSEAATAPQLKKSQTQSPSWENLRPPQDSFNNRSMFGKTNAATATGPSPPPPSFGRVPQAAVSPLWQQPQQKMPSVAASATSANPVVNPLWQQRSSAFSPAQQPFAQRSQQELLPGLFGKSKAFDKGLGPIKSALQDSAPFTVPIFNMFGHALGQAGKSITSALANRVASGVYDATNKTVDSISKFGRAGTQYVAGGPPKSA
jgi:hypothetical protein